MTPMMGYLWRILFHVAMIILRIAAGNAEDTLKRLEYIDTETHGFRCADCGHSSSSHHDTCELAASLKELAKVT